MSFDPVFRAYDASEKSIRETVPNVPYTFANNSLLKTSSLFIKWLEVYREFAKGYSKELLTRTTYYILRWLSSSGDTCERKFREIVDAKIPPEAYILLSEFFDKLGHGSIAFVLAEGSHFEQTSIYSQLSETLRSLSYPRPLSGSSKIDMTIKDVQSRDVFVFYYERGQSDNVLAWPLLLHEGFHPIYVNEKLHRVARNCPDVPWLDEALIDIYITNFFGPAYAMSLATYLQRFPYEVSISHPSFSSRIFIALQYLTILQSESRLPQQVGSHVSKVFHYLKDIWDQHKAINAKDVQETVETIYNSAEGDIRRVISEKTKPFVDFLLEIERKRKEVLDSTDVDYPEREILSISDVVEYFEHGIPIAADPRILFNSFMSEAYQKMATEPALNIFITESLKKWHVKNAWLRAKEGVS